MKSIASACAIVMVAGVAVAEDCEPADILSVPLAFPAGFPQGEEPDALATGDLNGDGNLDIVVANFASDDFAVLLGTNGLPFQAGEPVPTGDGPAHVAIGDVNADGHPDVVTANFHGDSTWVHLGNGDGTFADPLSFFIGDQPIWVILAELTDDEHLDLAVSLRGPGEIHIRPGVGDGTFLPPFFPGAEIEVGQCPGAMALGDLDADGDPRDFVVELGCADANEASVVLRNQDGTFDAADKFVVASELNGVAIVRLNDDPFPDLVFGRAAGSGRIYSMLNLGDGSFEYVDAFTAGNTVSSVAAADFNGDGIQDVVATNEVSDTVSLFIGVGDGTFLPQAQFDVGNGPRDVVTGDFDKDGDVDVAFANKVDDTVSVLSNVCGGQGGDCFADFNGDGCLNILDFVSFQLAWLADADEADCNADGVFNVLDFVCFQLAFQEGCE